MEDKINNNIVGEPAVAYQQISYNARRDNGQHVLNAAQLHFLKILQFLKTEEDLTELKQIISDYYLQKLEKNIDEYWGNGKITDDILNEHLRTPYKEYY